MPRKIVGGFVLLLAIFAIPVRAEEWSKTFELNGKADLRVETNDASVQVEAWEGKEIQARVVSEGVRIGLWGSSDTHQVRVRDFQSGNRVELEVRIPSTNWVIGVNTRSARIELKVPREASLDIHSGDGDLSVHGLKGEINLSTQDGKIEADSLEGALHATTGDGNMRVQGRFDSLNLRTGDGRIYVQISQGSQMVSGWSVRSGDGNVELSLPEGFSADLDVHTGDGRITSDLPITVSGSLDHSSLRGKLNGGGPTLSVQTGDGSVHLKRL
ncbi:MAG: DUF4097 family beta strand repeat-containing protein [Terriglobia bacterium]|jgi:DUF4097 and DUF4098 domain-containing protein YvlB